MEKSLAQSTISKNIPVSSSSESEDGFGALYTNQQLNYSLLES